jgi:hypothetical protein
MDNYSSTGILGARQAGIAAVAEQRRLEAERRQQWTDAWSPLFENPGAAALRKVIAFLRDQGLAERLPEIKKNRIAAELATPGAAIAIEGERNLHLAERFKEAEILALNLLVDANNEPVGSGVLETSLEDVAAKWPGGVAELVGEFRTIRGYLWERLQRAGQLPAEPEAPKSEPMPPVDTRLLEQPAGESDAFVPAASIWRERFDTYKQFKTFLDGHADIRTYSPRQNRLKVHAADWTNHWSEADKRKFDALDGEATPPPLTPDLAPETPWDPEIINAFAERLTETRDKKRAGK